ncbi:MAG: DUF58 domain-containing protein [Deltaproteobacteria bacterium]|nr:DUF58 domain-containing protein [Deltaproteobacteria bacterium]
MSDHDLSEVSTLASLQPMNTRELHYRDYKNRLRLQGSQFMSLKRPSRLIESSRDYIPGDPVALIDWRVYARSDRLIVREVRDESASHVRIGIDLSSTMWWPTADVTRDRLPTKAEIAMRIALHLSYAHLRMGDQVEVFWLTEDSDKLPPFRFRPRRPAMIQSQFSQLEAGGFHLSQWFQVERSSYPDTTVDVTFWIGDGLGNADSAGFLRQGARSFFWHTLSSMELSTSWLDDQNSYFDRAFATKEYRGSVLKQQDQYLGQVRGWCDSFAQLQHAQGGAYETVSDSTAIGAYQTALTAFFKANRRL